MLRTFIQVMAVLLTLFSSILLVKSAFILSPKDIAELTLTRVGYSPPVLKNLSKQQADIKVGIALLLSSFIIQIINLMWPMRLSDFDFNKNGAIFAIIVAILISSLALKISSYISEKVEQKAKSIVEDSIK